MRLIFELIYHRMPKASFREFNNLFFLQSYLIKYLLKIQMIRWIYEKAPKGYLIHFLSNKIFFFFVFLYCVPDIEGYEYVMGNLYKSLWFYFWWAHKRCDKSSYDIEILIWRILVRKEDEKKKDQSNVMGTLYTKSFSRYFLLTNIR